MRVVAHLCWHMRVNLMNWRMLCLSLCTCSPAMLHLPTGCPTPCTPPASRPQTAPPSAAQTALLVGRQIAVRCVQGGGGRCHAPSEGLASQLLVALPAGPGTSAFHELGCDASLRRQARHGQQHSQQAYQPLQAGRQCVARRLGRRAGRHQQPLAGRCHVCICHCHRIQANRLSICSSHLQRRAGQGA